MATVTLTQLRYLQSAFTCCTPGCGKLLDAGSKSIPCGHTYCEACVYAQIDSRNVCAVCEVPVMIGQARSCTLLHTLVNTVNDLIERCEAKATTTAAATTRTAPALAALSQLAPPLPASATARIGESSPVTPRRLSETPTTPACLPAAAASSTSSSAPSAAAAPPAASPSPAGAAGGAGGAALHPSSPGFGPSGSPRLLCSPPPSLPAAGAGGSAAAAASSASSASASVGGWEGVRGMMGSRWDLSYRAILEAVGGSDDAGGPSAAAVAALHRVREIDEELEAHTSVLSAQGVSVDTAATPVVRRKRPREEDAAAAAAPAVATTSGLSRSVRCEVERECAEAGVRYVEHDGPSSMASDGVTHLLTIDPAPRTLKYCFAIARGLWVLRRQVLHGLEYGGLEAGSGAAAAAAVARAEVQGDTGKGAAAARGPALGRLARAAREEGRRSFVFEGREYPAVLLEGFAYTLCEPLLAVTAADVGALCAELGAVKHGEGTTRTRHLVLCEGKSNLKKAQELLDPTAEVKHAIHVRSLLALVCTWNAL